MDDDLEDLLKRIEQLPSAVADLYLQRWRVQNSDHGIHSQDAAHIFAFGRHFPMPLFQLAVALSPSLCAMYMDKMRPMDESHLADLSFKLVKRLNARTAGLIECTRSEEDSAERAAGFMTAFHGVKGGGSSPSVSPWRTVHVRYIHRTVHDFLTGSEEGRWITGTTRSTLSDEEVDRAWLLSYLACIIEDVRPLSMCSVYELAFSPTWLSQTQGEVVDLFNKLCGRMAVERTGMSSSTVHNWYSWLQCKADFPFTVFHDVPGLLMSGGVFSLQHLLTTKGSAWSSYCKGYLTMCVITFTLGIGQNQPHKADVRNTFKAVGLLKSSGADLTSPHPYCSKNAVLAFRSPATRLLLELCLVLLGSDNQYFSLKFVKAILDVLSDLHFCGQKLTLFCDLDSFALTDGSGVEPRWYSAATYDHRLMLTFDAGELHQAILTATEAHMPVLELIYGR